ncbi:hypothetical protein K439DRAFT_1624101 [Ramaria rubella]|nr:hypothetical protein K439DRAFT_1624101 [Ramaria rubella]
MAPRRDGTGQVPSASQTQQDASSEGIEGFELPRRLVTQLAKSALSPDIKLDADTITALVKGSTVFINYLSLWHSSSAKLAAQEIAASRAHKTISGADVLKALETLEFGELVAAFQDELEVFRQGSRGDKGKIKTPVEMMKGKSKENDSSIRFAAHPDPSNAMREDISINESHESMNAPNGVPVADTEMLDDTENAALLSDEAADVRPVE